MTATISHETKSADRLSFADMEERELWRACMVTLMGNPSIKIVRAAPVPFRHKSETDAS
jgi:hypothetical protein